MEINTHMLLIFLFLACGNAFKFVNSVTRNISLIKYILFEVLTFLLLIEKK